MKLFLLANEKPAEGEQKDSVIRVPYGTWDYGTKKLDSGRTVYFTQTLAKPGAEKIAATIAAKIAAGEKGIPVYWGHPDVPDLAYKYPDKRAKGWIVAGEATDDALLLTVDWIDEKPTEGFGWFSPYWGGENRDLGGGKALSVVNDIRSVALINEPNIEEFRLANELQDTKSEGRYHMNQKLIEELAAKRDGNQLAANEANYDEYKHPRAEDGKWTSGGRAGGGSSGGANSTQIFDFGSAMKKKREEMKWDYNNPDHWNAALKYRAELAKAHPEAQAAYDAKHKKIVSELAAKRK